MRRCRVLLVIGLAHLAGRQAGAQQAAPSIPGRYRIEVPSSSDGTLQPSYLYVPTRGRGSPKAPLAVVLHTWSFDLEQRQQELEAEAEARGWFLLAPNFRGRNDHPEACGSSLAQQDVLDAVSWVRNRYAVDDQRVYVLGLSGGGHMTMLMAARHPEVWAAASAWVGISDLKAWYTDHSSDDYGRMMRACLGGSPTESASVAREFSTRSPLTYLTSSLKVPLDLAAGRFDSTVSITHTLRAFQALAPGSITEAEISALLGAGPGLPQPTPGDTVTDVTLGHRIFLRRVAGPSRVTIFDGGHEWVPRAAVAWLATHRKR